MKTGMVLLSKRKKELIERNARIIITFIREFKSIIKLTLLYTQKCFTQKSRETPSTILNMVNHISRSFFRSFNVALLKYRHSLKSRDSFEAKEPLLRLKAIKKENREKRATWKRGGKMFEARYDLISMRKRNETR